MKRLKREGGVTLVELIAAMALAGIVGVVIMTMFSIGSRHNAVETQNLNLQQEMNLIISKLTHAHRKGDCYRLDTENDQLRKHNYIRSENGACSETPVAELPSEIVSEGMDYDICRLTLSSNKCADFSIVDPELEDLRLHIKIGDGNNKSLSQTTTLTRIKVGEINGTN